MFLVLAFAQSCATATKKEPELSELEGKKVALVEVDAEETARKIVEVALVNQLIARGTFILTPRGELEKIRAQPDLKPTDWKGLTQRAGADYALKAKVLQFDADLHEGYNTEETEDSVLEQERGDGRTTRVFKAKTLDGMVKVELTFVRIFDDETRSAIAEARETVTQEAKTEAIRMPPKLRFLESLANKAFKDFFERYH